MSPSAPLLTHASGRRQLRDIYRDGLLEDTLRFWLPRAVDPDGGGFLTAFDHDGRCVDTDKSLWAQGRFSWLLGELYNELEPRTEWRDALEHGIRFLDRFGFDPEDGRMWFHVDRHGAPLRKRRYAFTESFAAIAYGEWAKATDSPEARDRAEACYREFLRHSHTPRGVTPKFTGQRPLQAIGLPMITIATAQELRGSIGLADADASIEAAINKIASEHVLHDRQVVMETVVPGGGVSDHFDGRTLNPGHAIEAAWFIMHEGKCRGRRDWIELGTQMLDYMWARGWDTEFGGILYFVDLDGHPVQEYWHDMKFWWPHNETIIATLLAYQLTGDSKYAHWHQQVHDWSYKHFPDRRYGEWFGYLHRDGSPSVTLKGNLWKGPFHLPRMQWYCWRRLEEMLDGWESPSDGLEA